MAEAADNVVNDEKGAFLLPPEFFWKGDKDAAIAHMCEHLKKGGCPLSVIRSRMIPPIPKTTLADWRAKNDAYAKAIDDAFEIGSDAMAQRMLLTAAGVNGYSRGNVKRDRLLVGTQEKLLAKWDRRYRERLVHENDPDNPAPSPTFVLQPVKSLQEIEKKPPTRSPGEDDAEVA